MMYEQDPKSIPEHEKVEATILCAFIFIPFSQILFFPVSFIPFLLNKNPSFTFAFILDIILMICFMFFVGAGIGNMIWRLRSKKKN